MSSICSMIDRLIFDQWNMFLSLFLWLKCTKFDQWEILLRSNRSIFGQNVWTWIYEGLVKSNWSIIFGQNFCTWIYERLVKSNWHIKLAYICSIWLIKDVRHDILFFLLKKYFLHLLLNNYLWCCFSGRIFTKFHGKFENEVPGTREDFWGNIPGPRKESWKVFLTFWGKRRREG